MNKFAESLTWRGCLYEMAEQWGAVGDTIMPNDFASSMERTLRVEPLEGYDMCLCLFWGDLGAEVNASHGGDWFIYARPRDDRPLVEMVKLRTDAAIRPVTAAVKYRKLL